jgi:hypothetical protein
MEEKISLDFYDAIENNNNYVAFFCLLYRYSGGIRA